MDTSQIIKQNKSVLRRGGVTCILGGVILVLSIIAAVVFALADPPTWLRKMK